MKKIYQITLLLLFHYTAFTQTISSNAPLCVNQNLTLELTATGGSTYAWTGPDGFVSTLQKPTLKNVNWKNRGVYTVTIDDKTTLTTDVNIKDPVAFTVPKEISVCEGGTLIIEPKSGKLTDSTEVADFFKFLVLNPKYNDANQSGIFENMNSDKVGSYEVYGHSDSKGCGISKFINVKLNTSPNCKSIQIEDLTKIKMCYGQNIVVPFTTNGNFVQGTKFKVYVTSLFNPNSNDFNKSLTIVDKSPVILNIDKYFDQTIAIVIIADDAEKTTAISNSKYFYSNYRNRSASINVQQTCDSSNLSINLSSTNINSLQWHLDGNSINGATKSDFVAKKVGTYTFRFKVNTAQYEIDKTCLYESQPVKIELGKIPKPSAYVSNDIELCVGKPATLNVSTNLNTNYRWKKDGVFIANATKSTFETLQEGKYQVEAKEGTCTAVSDTVVLKKPENKNLGIILVNDKDYNYLSNPNLSVCNSKPFNLRFYKYGVGDPSVKFQFQWFKNGEVVKDSTRETLYQNKQAGTFFTKITYGECTSITKKVTVEYTKNLKAKIFSYGQNVPLCVGSYDSLVASINPVLGRIKEYKDFAWYKDGSIFPPDNSGFYGGVLTPKYEGKYSFKETMILEDGSECPIISDTVNVAFSRKIQATSYGYDDKIKAVPPMSFS